MIKGNSIISEVRYQRGSNKKHIYYDNWGWRYFEQGSNEIDQVNYSLDRVNKSIILKSFPMAMQLSLSWISDFNWTKIGFWNRNQTETLWKTTNDCIVLRTEVHEWFMIARKVELNMTSFQLVWRTMKSMTKQLFRM